MQLKLTKTEGVFSEEKNDDRLITSSAKGSWSYGLYARTSVFPRRARATNADF